MVGTKLFLFPPIIMEYKLFVDKITFEYNWKRELLFFDLEFYCLKREISPSYEEEYRL